MKLKEIKARAEEIGVVPEGRSKAPIIRSIQKAEGNTQCYGVNDGTCPYTVCCFWKDCETYFRKHR